MQLDLTREWLETNGIGGFAASTPCGANTRRYHALLCAATKPLRERAVLVSKAEESLIVHDWGGDEAQFQLGTNLWPNAVSPRGYEYISSFTIDPLPRWVFTIPGTRRPLQLQKTLWMPAGHNTAIIEYVLLDGPSCELSVRPFIPARDFHLARRGNSGFQEKPEVSPGIVAMKPYPALPWIVFSHDGRFQDDGHWYYDFEWPVERERGLESHEDAYCPGSFVFKLTPGEKRTFIVSTSPQAVALAAATKSAEIARRIQLAKSETWTTPVSKLRLAAGQFIVRDENRMPTVIAGYPWFGEWGRDTMISLPGLCLSTGRFDVAKAILLRAARNMSRGMIPNFVPENGDEPDYAAADTTLWFFHAVQQYLQATGDDETVRELYPSLVESIEWHLAGTRHGIVADPEDGMLMAGDGSLALTWMNSCSGGTPVLPRGGKPVEVQALWYNALRFMTALAKRFEDPETAEICAEWSRKVASRFESLFWNEDEGCLYDGVCGGARDPAVRPNQIFAVSLPYPLLAPEQEMRVVQCVLEDLLTPYGLRTLSPGDKRYRGSYRGPVAERDAAYHQGTVWAWLMGPFITAYLKVHGNSAEAKAQAREWLRPLLRHLDEAGLNSVSQLFDGEAPQTPRGCFAQAWSVAEILRVLDEC